MINTEFQCDALQQTVASLEGTLMLRVKELNETYEDLDTIRSDLRVAEVKSFSCTFYIKCLRWQCISMHRV